MCVLEHLAGAAYTDKNEPKLEPLIVDRFIREIYDIKIKRELCRSPLCNNLTDVLSKALELEEAFKKCEELKSILQHNNPTKQNTNNRNSNNRVDSQESIQPLNTTESQVDDNEKSIEGICLINEIPINFTIDTGAQITVISDKVYNSLQNSSPLELVSHEVAGAGGNRL
ncbi:unnamed protein product [Brachionus calyciflorus]|uniref:Peptidase A2 domain-containing protein n=1 Tax=Brachionus calyciflorus TaxID=104777 RepID=A0A813X3I8_9BILA|nr:unnamed protein product [Brachionus calyciflorus]